MYHANARDLFSNLVPAMEIDLSEQKSGRLWTRRPESIGTDAFLRISRFERNLQGLGRRILFSASTASARDSSFAAVDRQGRFYVFNLSTNSFALSHSFGTPSTTVSFSPGSNSSLAAVALTDRSVRIVDLDRGDVRGRIDVERESVVQHVDFHPSGRFALLSTARGVDLWDVDGAERRRTLRGVNQTVVKVSEVACPRNKKLILITNTIVYDISINTGIFKKYYY